MSWGALSQYVAGLAPLTQPRLTTPYGQADQLARATFDYLWPADPDGWLSRDQAMGLPGMARARHLLCSTAGRTPLEVVDSQGQQLATQPTWVDPRDPAQASAFMRAVWTVDDLLFSGGSLWLADRDSAGTVQALNRAPMGSWDIDDQGRVTDADGKPHQASRVVYIPGPHDGVLTFGQESMRLARDLAAAAREQAARPFRLELHQTSDAALTRAERSELVADARSALRTQGGVLFTNPALEAKVHQLASGELLTAGREASARDLARLADVPAGMIDAPSGDTMTYANVAQRLREFLTFGAASYLTAIAARLSMDDITPVGTSVTFDTAQVLADLAETSDDGSSPA